jgi:hypothetical protein
LEWEEMKKSKELELAGIAAGLHMMQPTTSRADELIACLEGEVKSRDARIAELEHALEVEIMRLAACGAAALGYFDGCADEYKSGSLDDVLNLRAELAAMKAQEPAGWTVRGPDGRLYLSDYATEDEDEAGLWPSTLIEGFTVVRVYAAPVAKQQVVMPERKAKVLAGISLFDIGHADGWNSALDEVARLNAANQGGQDE